MEEATDLHPLESETEESEIWQKQLQIKLSFKSSLWNCWDFTLTILYDKIFDSGGPAEIHGDSPFIEGSLYSVSLQSPR